jgi:hypothetical protein
VKAGVRAVSCVFRFMIYYMDAINKVGTFSIQDAVSYCVGDKVQTKNPESWRTGVSGNETSGSQEILSGLGIYCDWYRRGPYTFAYGYSTEICGQYGCGDFKEEHEQGTKPEVSFPQAGVLGQRGYMVQRIFRLHSWYKRSGYQEIRSATGKGRHRTSAA